MQSLLFLTLLRGGAWLALAQGPDSGSPFVDASLPFEQLKAPPASAFEILMVSLGVAFLAALVTAAFLALGKLGSLQDQLRREFALREAARKAGPGAENGATTAGLGESLEALREELSAARGQMDGRVEELLSALNGNGAAGADGAGPHGMGPAHTGLGGDPLAGGEVDPRILGAMGELTSALATFQSAAEAQSSELSVQVEALSRTVARIGSVDLGGGTPGVGAAEVGSGPATAASTIHAARANLSARGYSQVEVITPPEDIDAARLRAGELVVEAKRGGAVFKGRVLIEEGQVVDVLLRPSHKIFP